MILDHSIELRIWIYDTNRSTLNTIILINSNLSK